MTAFFGEKGYRINSSVYMNVPENYTFPYLERHAVSIKTAHSYVSLRLCDSRGMPGLRKVDRKTTHCMVSDSVTLDWVCKERCVFKDSLYSLVTRKNIVATAAVTQDFSLEIQVRMHTELQTVQIQKSHVVRHI